MFTPKGISCALMFCLFFTCLALAGSDDWREVTAAELQMKTPKVEPDADAEAIFWEVRVDDSSADGLAMKHYVRVKIFTDRGREMFSKHDIPFGNGTRIKDVEARVTKPDGTTVLLNKNDVLEREILKANGFKVKAKSFAFPALEVGSIVEYRYREVIDNAEANMRLIFQREVPIETISYYVKPFSGTRGMYYEKFHVGDTKFEKDKNGFSVATMSNVPALHEEPYMLPEDEIRAWMYIYYLGSTPQNAKEYWTNIAKIIYDGSKSSLKANDDVKAVTQQVIAGATSDEDKLRKIYDFTKTLKNTSYSQNVTDEDKKKVRESKTPADTLKLKMGSPGDIDGLFGAMARAAGFDARIALSGNRNELFFNPNIPNYSLMLNSSSIAVKVGEKWRFFSPASYYVPFGMLSWVEENQMALITDPKEAIWEPIPLTTPATTLAKRTGKFKLLDDGTLVGEARIEYSGHWGVQEKRLNADDSQAEREKTLKKLIQENILGSAEVESFTIENVNDPDKPFVYTFKIRVPNYASKTGKRLFFQPNVFERNSHPTFTSNTRKYDIYFPYPFAENDDLTIEFPTGYSLENADAPGLLKDPQGIGSNECRMAVTKDGKTLVYKRTFSFGNGGMIRFPVEAYPALKNMFEAFNKADVHQLTLKQAATTAATPTN